MANSNGHRKLLEQLRADGLTTIFGNPGSSEEGLLDEIARTPAIRYLLVMQEAALVCMADGYAQATRRPAVVQLHTGVGLGNAIGSLYHAYRRQTPLVVLAGEAGIAYDALQAHMAVDLVAMATPVTKYAARAIHPGSVLRLLRRCIKIASTPPWGPVFLAIPQDILDQANNETVVPTVIPETRVAPEPALIARAAEMLAGAERPVILVGDGVSQSGAQEELGRFADTLGAGVWGAMASELLLPWTHPLYCGLTGHMFGHASARIVEDADAVVICGTYVFPDVFPLLTSPFRADAKVIHIDLDQNAIAKNHPVTLGLVSDPKLTLRLLAEALTDNMTATQKAASRSRVERIGTDNAGARELVREQDQAARELVPLRMSAFAEVLARHIPKDAILFDESLTHFPELTRWVIPSQPGSLFQTPGGTLGVGIPGAVGVKLAHPERTVIGLTGDGGAMYTYQALWTAAHNGIGAKFIVCNNRSYRLLKQNLVDYWQTLGLKPEQMPQGFPPSFDIREPDVDFVGLARALGVPGLRVTQPAEIEPAVATMLDGDGPFLLELVLENNVERPPVPTPGACTGHVPCS
jgi:benzoylformate decarboxylase